MRIKSIKKTNDFVYVDFSEIKDCWNGAEILTPSGFTPIKSFSFIKNGPTKILRLSNGMVLECDPCHKLMTKAGAKFAKDLDFDDALIGIDGDITFTINDGQPQDLYDIEIDSPHWYYTSGVLSHNSIMLVNNAVANIKRGKNVLYVTLEMSDLATALRALGAMTGKPVKKRMDYKEQIMQSISHLKNSGDIGDLVFHELPPDETSVDSLYALCDVLRRTKSWVPDVICVDYLELMVSRRASDNKDQYQRQKATATQLRGFARAENVLLFTATQTNRSGNDSSTSAPIDVTKMAESYGKSMPMDYLVSINQSLEEYEAGKDSNTGVMVYPAMARMYIAKNRFGIKFKTIAVRINYNTYKIEEHL